MANWYNNTRGMRQRRFRNSLTTQVQARMDSVMEAHQDKVKNSLAVESLECIVYRRSKIGLPCSCTMIEADDEIDAISAAGKEDRRQSRADDVIEFDGGMFGGANSFEQDIGSDSTVEVEVGAISSMHSDAGYEEHAMGGNQVNCPICYREGYVPAYQPIGFSLCVLTEKHICKQRGYTEEQTQPCTMRKIDADGYADFEISVPKYFTRAVIAVRNNTELLPLGTLPSLVVGGKEYPLTKANLAQHRGTRVGLRVRTDFTHVTCLFDLGANPIMCNVSEETDVLDYDKDLTVANLSIVLPHTVGSLQPLDILVIPKRNYVLMISDTPRKRNAKGVTWEWVVQTRTVQRKEMLYNVHKGHVIR